MSGFLTDYEVCDSEWDETWGPLQGPLKNDESFTWRAPWKKFQIRVMESNGFTQQCCSSLLNPLKMQFLTEKNLHLEKLYQVLKRENYNVRNICSTTELLEIKLEPPDVSDIVSEIEAVLANEFDDIILKTIPVFPHTPKLAEKLFWNNLKDGNLTLMCDDTKIFIVGFAKMRAIIQKRMDEIDCCSKTETVKLIENWKSKAIKKFSLIETLSTKFKDVKCTFDEQNSCVHLAGLDATLAEFVGDLEKAFSSLFVTKLAFDPLVLKLLKCADSSELFSELLEKAKITAVWTVDDRDLFVFSRVKTNNKDILKSIVYENFVAAGFTFKRDSKNAFCNSKYFLGLVQSNKNKLLVEETTPKGVNIAATKTIVHQILNLENTWNIWKLNAVKLDDLQDPWSPHLNKNIIYDRECLLQLQFAQTSTKKPKDLPDLPEVILQNSSTQTECESSTFVKQFAAQVADTLKSPSGDQHVDDAKKEVPHSIVSKQSLNQQPNETSAIAAQFAERVTAALESPSWVHYVQLANKEVPPYIVSTQVQPTIASNRETSYTPRGTTQGIQNWIPEEQQQQQPQQYTAYIQQGGNIYSQTSYTPRGTTQGIQNWIPEEQQQQQPQQYTAYIQQGGNIYSQPFITQHQQASQQQSYELSKSFGNPQFVPGQSLAQPQNMFNSQSQRPAAQFIPHQSQQPNQQQSYDLNKCFGQQMFVSGQSLAQPQNMFHNQSMRPTAPLYPQQQSMSTQQQRVQMGHQQGQMSPTMMYMPPSQPGNTINSYGYPIISKPYPGQMPQTMMIPGQRMPTPSTTYNISTTQSVGGYPIPQTTYPSTTTYPVQTIQNPPLAQGVGKPSQKPATLKKKVLQIIGHNTGEDKLKIKKVSTTGSPLVGLIGQTTNKTTDNPPLDQGVGQPSQTPTKQEKKVQHIIDHYTGEDKLRKIKKVPTSGSPLNPPSDQGVGQPSQKPAKQEKKVQHIIDHYTGEDKLRKIKKVPTSGSPLAGFIPQTTNESIDEGTILSRTSQKKYTQGSSVHENVSSVQHVLKPYKADFLVKPSHKETCEAKGAEDVLTEEIYKTAPRILSMLTPQKFQTLVKQMSDLEISSEEQLKGVTNLVFEKAIAEPEYSVVYASMCRYLSKIEVPSASKPDEIISFRAILLTRCQKEFEKYTNAEDEIETRRVSMKEETHKEKVAEIQKEIELAETNNRRRYMGNIRFIGELFKVKMLTDPIMHECVAKLLNNTDEESLEYACVLLRTVGKELDIDRAKPRIDQYFQKMKKLAEKNKTSSRVRFMIQDVIDLRSSNWIQKRDKDNQQTTEQINEEVQQEEQEKMLILQKVSVQPKSGSVSGQGGGAGALGGWRTVGSKGSNVKGERQTIDPSRLKLSTQNVDDNLQLGPDGGAGRFAGWQRGSSGGGATAASQDKATANRFSILSKLEEDGRSIAGGKTTSREESSKEICYGSECLEGTLLGSEKPVPASGNQYTDDEIIKKTHAILNDYLELLDIKEALTCVEELSSSPTIHVFVVECIIQVLDRSNQARRQTGLLLRDLVKKSIITEKQYLHGLNSVLIYAEDMEIYIPKIWRYFAEVIGPLVQDGSVPLSFLKEACQPLKESGKAGNLVAEIIHDASDREGHKKVGILWRDSGLQWSDFLPEDRIEQFLKENKLEFTVTDGNQPSTRTVRMPLDRIQEHLHDLVVENPVNNEEIFAWIEANLDDLTTKDKKFIRVLMTVVCSSAVRGHGNNAKVDPTRIKQRRIILQTYLDQHAEFKLQALYALQAFAHKLELPKGVIKTLFKTLYVEDIIAEDTIDMWRLNKDPAEQDGKVVATKQAV